MVSSSAFLMVVLCLAAGGGFNTLEAKSLVTFKRNIDQVLKEWNCNKPQERLVYLGMSFDLTFFRLILLNFHYFYFILKISIFINYSFLYI